MYPLHRLEQPYTSIFLGDNQLFQNFLTWIKKLSEIISKYVYVNICSKLVLKQ